MPGALQWPGWHWIRCEDSSGSERDDYPHPICGAGFFWGVYVRSESGTGLFWVNERAANMAETQLARGQGRLSHHSSLPTVKSTTSPCFVNVS